MTLGDGVRAFIDGSRLARSRQLLHYTLVPALISLVIIALGSWYAIVQIDVWGAQLTRWLPSWLSFLDVILVPLLYLLGMVLGIWLFGLLAVVIASPFLGPLSAAVEVSVRGHAPADSTRWWIAIGATLLRELRKLAYHLPRLLGVFLITLIPVVNVATPAIWLLFGAWTMAVQFCDFPLENRQRPFQDTLQLLRRHRLAALGFGLCTALTLAIPLLNFVVIPVAVCAGTLLWDQMDKQSG